MKLWQEVKLLSRIISLDRTFYVSISKKWMTDVFCNALSEQTQINDSSNESFTLYSLFWLAPLIYAEKFEFENPAIMEEKQRKQMEWFLAMTKERDYFLSLDDKSK